MIRPLEETLADVDQALQGAVGLSVATLDALPAGALLNLLRPGDALAAERVKAWLEADPLVSRTGLAVGMPDLHEVSELGSVMLTQPDGLGADLNEAQEDLLQRASELAIQSANATNSDESRGAIAVELRERLSEIAAVVAMDLRQDGRPLRSWMTALC